MSFDETRDPLDPDRPLDPDFVLQPEAAPEPDDGRGPLVIAAGLAASLVGGAAWAAVALLTDREIGFVAWAIGLLVGLAMSRVTVQRTRGLAVAAAGFAVLGLLVGRVLLFLGSAGPVAKQLEADQEAMTNAVTWQMYLARELEPPTLEAVDALRESGDTLSDALWADMREQGGARLAAMTDEQKHDTALSMAKRFMHSAGVIGGVRAQLGAYDLLWLLLAVASAFRLMSPAKGKRAVG